MNGDKDNAATVRKLFEQVQDMPAQERVALLDATCGSDTHLREQVEALLEAAEEADSRFERMEEDIIRPSLESVRENPASLNQWIDRQFAPAADSAAEQVGETVSHYEILEVIGRGGMGVVVRAHDVRLDRTVALKFLPAYLSADPAAKARLVQEARTASGLDHPNIATIFEVGETEAGQVFIAMGYYPGETLQAALNRKSIPLKVVLEYSLQLASALQQAHEKGIVHRDLKPANVLIAGDGSLRLVDFGLAKIYDASLYTQTGVLAGTAAYMSPEQVSGKPVDARTDIWSFGVILYEMLTGKRLFDGESLQSVLHQIFQAEQRLGRIDKLMPPDIPKSIVEILKGCLVKDPEGRYAAMADVLDDLKQVKAGLAPTRRPVKRSKTKNGLLLAASVAILVLCVSSLILFREGPSPPLSAEAPIDSIAVLPFVNLSEDSGQDTFVDGVHDAIITNLAMVESLQITSRPTSMRYRETDLSVPEIAREIGVKGIVLGSVQISADQIRVTAQLVDPVTDSYLWADSYERSLSAANVFGIQGEITTSIARALQAVLLPREQGQIGTLLTENLAALEAYYRGRMGRLSYSLAGRRQAVDELQRAIELDPEFAEAYAELALTYRELVIRDGEPFRLAQQSAELAEKALQMNPELPEALRAKAAALFSEGDVPGAVELLKRAVDLDPNDGEGWVQLASGLLTAGHGFYQVYSPLLEQVVREKPEIFSRLDLAWLLWRARHDEQALEIYREELERNPNNPRACWAMGDYHYFKQQYVDAMYWYRRSHAIQPESNPHMIPHIYTRLDDKEARRQWTEHILKRTPEWDTPHPYQIQHAIDDGDLDRAVELYHALPDRPFAIRVPVLWLFRGLINAGQPERALELIDDLYPELRQIHNTHATNGSLTTVDDPFHRGQGGVLRIEPGSPLDPLTEVLEQNRHLHVYKGSPGHRLKAYRELPEAAWIQMNRASEQATLYLKIGIPMVDGAPAKVRLSCGLAHLPDKLGRDLFFLRDYSVHFGISREGNLYIQNHSQRFELTEKPLETNRYYELWHVINHAENRFDVYIRGGTEFPRQKRVYSSSRYQNKTEAPLNHFLIMTQSGGGLQPETVDPAFLDDTYVDPRGKNLGVPDPSWIAVDDFENPGSPEWHVLNSLSHPLIRTGTIDAVFCMAQAWKALGENERAEKLCDEILKFTRMKGNWQSRVLETQIHALRGNREEVLYWLTLFNKKGVHWTAPFDTEVYRPYFDDPEFKALWDETMAPLKAQLARIREMEASGEIAPGLVKPPAERVPLMD